MANKNYPAYTLGLDIGIASVGAALLGANRILALHVRTFDKAEKEPKGDPLNLTRRNARLTRRRIRRRAFRLKRLCRLFKRVGLINNPTPQAFALTSATPWELRAAGLDRRLSPKEWAAVLYHIVKHRGFQSNRKSEAASDEKAGEMLSGVSANQKRLEESGFRTIGEMAAHHPDYAEAKRNKGGDYRRTFARADLELELTRLFAAQREFGNPNAEPDFQSEIENLLLARRPTLSGENLLKMVGRCTFETAEFRAPKASHRAERFVWLGKLNNLKIQVSGETRALDEREHKLLRELPFEQAKVTFKQVRKRLDLPEHARFNLVSTRNVKGDKDPEDATFFEAKHFHALRKAYESAGLKSLWQRDALDADRLDALAYAQTCYKDDRESTAWLGQRGIEPEIIDAVLTLSFDKFIHLSQKALIALLPYLEQGQRYDEAAVNAGYHHSQPEHTGARGYLPPPDKDQIRNPVVYRALNQARKLVNAIVREYGPPKAVHIELARDLNKPFDERKKIEKDQENFRSAKEQARTHFVELFGNEPNGLDLLKRRLYEEQGGKCAYSLEAIDLRRLCEPNYVEVDHALPYSRSYDDSQNNKVLVFTAENRNKGNRTPFEYLDGAHDSERWRRFESWVNSTAGLRQAKRMRLLRKHFGQQESSEFRDRNLNDTRYICRELKAMLETHLRWHPEADGAERCVVVAGQLTALLRGRWGLMKIRSNGELHHALDAAVIAAANRSLIKRMADYSRRKELGGLRGDFIDPETGEVLDLAALRQLEEHFPEPWPHFHRELKAYLSPNPARELEALERYTPEMRAQIRPIRVSRAPTRRGLGSAHQETIRSIGKNGSLLNQNQSAVKVPLSALTLKDLDNIVGAGDPRNAELMRILRERLEAFGGKGEKAFATPVYKPSAEGKTAPQIRSVKLLSTQKSGLFVRGGMANNGDMLRADIFTKGGEFYVVPVYVSDSAKTELPNKAVLQGKAESEWPVMDESFSFLFSLSPNDLVRVTSKGETREGYYSKLDRATGNISFWIHDRDRTLGAEGKIRGCGIKTATAVEKFHVDLLGRLHKVHQETRQSLKRISHRD